MTIKARPFKARHLRARYLEARHLRAGLCGLAALIALPFAATTLAAAPMRLDCTLATTGPDGKAVKRSVGIAFDAQANTLVFDEGGRSRKLAHVTISTISIDGYTDDLSIGIDRSSWSIVVQTYAGDQAKAEFGSCKPAQAAQ